MDDDFTVNQPDNKKKKKINFINERVVAALDAASVSDYKAMHIIIAIAEALGHNVNNLNISRSTISLFRKNNRETTTNRAKENFTV